MKPLLFLSLMGALAVAASALAAPAPTYIPAAPTAVPPPAVTEAAGRAAFKPIVPKKIILVGDSTTQVGSGWGGSFCADHVMSITTCVNLARGGRGTLDYRAEGSWALAVNEMKTPGYSKVYVLIQFGHNDQPGKGARTTDLYQEFPDNLRAYVREARAAGAIPVLVTPLARRPFVNGSLQDTLGPWAAAARTVATEMNVPLLDLHALSIAAVQAMGPRAALELSQVPPPPEVIAAALTGTTIDAPATPAKLAAPPSADAALRPQGRPSEVFDYTHLGAQGAPYFSKMVAIELARIVPDLRGDLIETPYAPSN